MGFFPHFRSTFHNIFFRNILFGLVATVSLYIQTWDHIDRVADRYKAAYLDKHDTFDFVVVGGGSSGGVVASRLAEKFKVLLLESGGDPHPFLSVPSFTFPLLNYAEFDWKHRTVPQEKACFAMNGHESSWSQGRSLGGSSNLNFLVHLRGHQKDFNHWAHVTGDPSWSYEGVQPFFDRSEDFHGPHSKVKHGHGGPIRVEIPNYIGLAKRWIYAGKEHGYEHIDLNGPFGEGFDTNYYTSRLGYRDSVYDGYLSKPHRRPNLTIHKFSHVTRVLFDGPENKAYGVEYDRHGTIRYAFANKEIILSAGAVQSPRILMLSGVGPAHHLRTLGIPVVKDLPVGQNLQDHLSTFIGPFFIKPGSSYLVDRDVGAKSFAQLAFAKGVLTTSVFQASALVSSSKAKGAGQVDWPDIHFGFSSFAPHSKFPSDFAHAYNLREDVAAEYFNHARGKDAFFIVPSAARPHARGEILLRDSTPYTEAAINPKYLQNDHDLHVLLEAIKIAFHLVENSTAFHSIGARYSTHLFPGCEQLLFRSDEYWECYLRHLSISAHNYAGTCPMGPRSSPYAVVDSELKVIGIKGLRVIDASIMPTIVSTPTGAAAIMIGEKGADMIKKTWIHDHATDYFEYTPVRPGGHRPPSHSIRSNQTFHVNSGPIQSVHQYYQKIPNPNDQGFYFQPTPSPVDQSQHYGHPGHPYDKQPEEVHVHFESIKTEPDEHSAHPGSVVGGELANPVPAHITHQYNAHAGPSPFHLVHQGHQVQEPVVVHQVQTFTPHVVQVPFVPLVPQVPLQVISQVAQQESQLFAPQAPTPETHHEVRDEKEHEVTHQHFHHAPPDHEPIKEDHNEGYGGEDLKTHYGHEVSGGHHEPYDEHKFLNDQTKYKSEGDYFKNDAKLEKLESLLSDHASEYTRDGGPMYGERYVKGESYEERYSEFGPPYGKPHDVEDEEFLTNEASKHIPKYEIPHRNSLHSQDKKSKDKKNKVVAPQHFEYSTLRNPNREEDERMEDIIKITAPPKETERNQWREEESSKAERRPSWKPEEGRRERLKSEGRVREEVRKDRIKYKPEGERNEPEGARNYYETNNRNESPTVVPETDREFYDQRPETQNYREERIRYEKRKEEERAEIELAKERERARIEATNRERVREESKSRERTREEDLNRERSRVESKSRERVREESKSRERVREESKSRERVREESKSRERVRDEPIPRDRSREEIVTREPSKSKETKERVREPLRSKERIERVKDVEDLNPAQSERHEDSKDSRNKSTRDQRLKELFRERYKILERLREFERAKDRPTDVRSERREEKSENPRVRPTRPTQRTNKSREEVKYDPTMSHRERPFKRRENFASDREIPVSQVSKEVDVRVKNHRFRIVMPMETEIRTKVKFNRKGVPEPKEEGRKLDGVEPRRYRDRIFDETQKTRPVHSSS